MRTTQSPMVIATMSILTVILISCADSEPTIPLPDDEHAAMTQPFDYTDYTKLLSIHVDEKGMVDYATLQKNRTPLESFIRGMGALSEETYAGWIEADQIAFWINAYNAITLKAIIDNYPIKKGGLIKRSLYPANSIRQIDGVWKKNTISIIGQDITLDAIEHKVLRALFDEPRIHFAIVCASISCPSLLSEAYEAEKLEAQLDDQARRFLADSGKFEIDESDKTIYLSPILDWFEEDFLDHYNLDQAITGRSKKLGAVLDFVRVHLDDVQAARLTDATYKIEYLDYDWSLNEQP